MTSIRLAAATIRLVADWSARHPTLAVTAALGALILALLVLAASRHKRRPRAGIPRYEKALTLAGVALATGMDAQGMWTVFTERVHMESTSRVVLFAFLPVVLIGLAVKARRNYLTSTDTPSMGVEGRWMWAIAAGSALISALSATNASTVVLRLGAPIVAAGLWHRQIVGERAVARGISAAEVTSWLRRWAVRLGFATPVTSTLTEIDTARRVTRLARLAYRMHLLEDPGHWWLVPQSRWAAWRWHRTIQAPAYAALVADPDVMVRVRRQLAVLYQATDGTTARAVADLSPWSADQPTVDRRPVARRADVPTDHPTPDEATGADQSDIDTRPTIRRPTTDRSARRVVLGSADDAPVLVRLRADYPDAEPSLGEVKKAVIACGAATCSQSKAIRLRDLIRDERAAQTA